MNDEILEDVNVNLELQKKVNTIIQILVGLLLFSAILELIFGIIFFLLFSEHAKVKSYILIIVLMIIAIWQFQASLHLLRFKKDKKNHSIAESFTKIGASFLIQAIGIGLITALQIYNNFR